MTPEEIDVVIAELKKPRYFDPDYRVDTVTFDWDDVDVALRLEEIDTFKEMIMRVLSCRNKSIRNNAINAGCTIIE